MPDPFSKFDLKSRDTSRRLEPSRSPVEAARELRDDFERLEQQLADDRSEPRRNRWRSLGIDPDTGHLPALSIPSALTPHPSQRTSTPPSPTNDDQRDVDVRALVQSAQDQISSLRAQLATLDQPRRATLSTTIAVAVLGALLSAGLVIWAARTTLQPRSSPPASLAGVSEPSWSSASQPGGDAPPEPAGRRAEPLDPGDGSPSTWRTSPPEPSPPALLAPVSPVPRRGFSSSEPNTAPTSGGVVPSPIGGVDAGDRTQVRLPAPSAVRSEPPAEAVVVPLIPGIGQSAPGIGQSALAPARGTADTAVATPPSRSDPPPLQGQEAAPNQPATPMPTRPEPAAPKPAGASDTAGTDTTRATRGDGSRSADALGSETREPILVSRRAPIYPEEARRIGARGTVEIEVRIDTTGRVVTATAVSGPLLLRQPAERAVSQWRYEPAIERGVRVESRRRVRINFE